MLHRTGSLLLALGAQAALQVTPAQLQQLLDYFQLPDSKELIMQELAAVTQLQKRPQQQQQQVHWLQLCWLTVLVASCVTLRLCLEGWELASCCQENLSCC